MLYALVAVVVVILIVFAVRFFQSNAGGPRFPPGTRAFESEMSLPLLAQMIEAREVELMGGVDDETKARLNTEISNMRKQAEQHRAVIAAGDVSPGKMSIGVNPSSDTID